MMGWQTRITGLMYYYQQVESRKRFEFIASFGYMCARTEKGHFCQPIFKDG